MNNDIFEEQVKEAIECCKGGKCEGCPFNGVSICCVTVLLHSQQATATFEKDSHHLRCSNCGAKMELLKEQEETKEQFIEAFNTIRDAYNMPANREKILLNYLLRNACCCGQKKTTD